MIGSYSAGRRMPLPENPPDPPSALETARVFLAASLTASTWSRFVAAQASPALQQLAVAGLGQGLVHHAVQTVGVPRQNRHCGFDGETWQCQKSLG